MTGPHLSVIVPTLPRPSLQGTLASIARAGVASGDEVITVVDSLAGKHRRSERSVYPADVDGHGFRQVLTAGAQVVTHWINGPHSDFGGAARNAGLAQAQHLDADWVCYLDDDDVYLDGALTAIRIALAGRDPMRPELHVFRARVNDPRVRTAADGCLWIDRELRVGNVSTCMLVHSLAPLADLDVRWRTDVYEHDYHFAADLVAAGFATYWHEGVIASVRPNGHLARITTCAHAG